MSDPFVGEIRLFAGNFAPRGWAFCNGQLLPISQNTALFSLLGTNFGGDGESTVRLPDLQGRSPMGNGNGPGLTTRRLGESGGSVTESLTETQIPSHTHNLAVDGNLGGTNVPTGAYLSGDGSGSAMLYGPAGSNTMAPSQITSAGAGQAHNNLPPYLAINFIIALIGYYPSES